MSQKWKQTAYSKVEEKSRRLVVRPYKFSDFKTCLESMNNRKPDLDKFDHSIFHHFKTLNYENFKVRVGRMRESAKDKHAFVFGVFNKRTGEYIGEIDLFVINQQLRWGNLGYQIHNQYAGMGYATEAARLSLKVAFKVLNFHRIEAGMEPDHTASKKIAEKIGLCFEGERKKFFPEKGGMDLLMYAANSIDYKL